MLAATLLRRTLCATTALALAGPASAQTVETPTPPARVGQIAGLLGDVSFNGAGSNGAWVAAQDNYPLTAGDSLYTAAGAEAAVALDSSRLTIAPLTELTVTSLDDERFSATQAQGELFLDLNALQTGQSFTIATQGGPVAMAASGEYDIIAGPTTIVSVLSGQATAGNVTIGAGQAVTLTDGQAQAAALEEDDFVRHVLGELSPPPPPYVPQVVDQMSGINELTSYGSWDQDPDYGAVWYPAVAADWAPYREGAWSYVAPWGWTWIEAEPWGFAPFHYGRWLHRGERWGWVPAADGQAAAGYTPVYAPAIVSFFGLAAGAAITADMIGSGRIGWVPLAPGESYHPPYRASGAYISRINRIDVPRDANTPRDITIDQFANRTGATFMPAAAMAHGERIGRAGGGALPPGDFGRARPDQGLVNQAIRPDIRALPAMNVPRTQDFRPIPARPGLPAVATPRFDVARPQIPAQLPRVETPGLAAPHVQNAAPFPAQPFPPMPGAEMSRPQAPRLEAPPMQSIQAPRLEAPHIQNAAPFAGAQAPRPEMMRPVAPPALARPPAPMNNPRPPG
jgi:hypothetical protein